MSSPVKKKSSAACVVTPDKERVISSPSPPPSKRFKPENGSFLSQSQEKYCRNHLKPKSAPWCMLKALHQYEQETGRHDESAVLTKAELKSKAEVFYEKKMEPDTPQLDSAGYGAWSSIDTLERHDLVKRLVHKRNEGNSSHGKKNAGGLEHKFHLTPAGRTCCQIKFEESGDSLAEKGDTSKKAAAPKPKGQKSITAFFSPKKKKTH